MALGGLPNNIHKIRELASKQAATITLGQLMRWRTKEPQGLIFFGKWLHEHLPIRFARRLDEFLRLPYMTVQNPHMKEVFEKYVVTLDRLLAFKAIRNAEDEANFCDLISGELDRHRNVAGAIATGYWEVRQMYPDARCDEFLDNLFTTRISSRILIENYVDMRNPRDGHSGVVQRDLKPAPIIRKLGDMLIALTESIYGISPVIEYRGKLDIDMDYIPSHIMIILREVLKNALRATVERHLRKNRGARDTLPPVVVELQKGDLNVVVKVSDHGGGIPKQLQKEVWQYGWTSADGTDAASKDLGCEAEKRKELAGYGFGLPLTRLYAEYFGGEVFMHVLPGHGTDVYLLLNHLREGSPSAEMDDISTTLATNENERLSASSSSSASGF